MCVKKPPDTRAGHLQMVYIHAAGRASDKDLRIKSNQNSVLAWAIENNPSECLKDTARQVSVLRSCII